MFKPKKLILSIFTLGLTAVTLTSTTYAWFARNNEAWTDDFDLKIENTENLLISIDGINYKSSLTNEDIKKGMVSKILDKSISELTSEQISQEYSKIKLGTVSTKDFTRFTTINSKEYSDGYYKIVDASKYSYISFDLYFRIDTSQENLANQYDLKLVDEEYANVNSVLSSRFKSDITTVKLHNSLTALDTLGQVVNYGPQESSIDDSGEVIDRSTIEINPVNAIRLGFDYNGEIQIYEPNKGYGSYAMESHKGLEDEYDPDCNAMLTYFNNIYEHKLKPLKDEEVPKTNKSFSDGIIATFEKNQDGLTYADVKITTYIWLEGYDADYVPGININTISTYLNFYKFEGGRTE